jgi:ABC-type glycerol-3-phosphate transport system substrate-binding protein
MAVDDKSMYLDQTDEKYGPLFYSGNVAMMLSGPWVLYDLKDQGGRVWGRQHAGLQRQPRDSLGARPLGALQPQRPQPSRRNRATSSAG